MYYACFYAVIALLIKNNISTQTHDGARTQFGLIFVKTGIIDKESGKLFSKLFDYNEELTKPLINKLNEFLIEIKKHL